MQVHVYISMLRRQQHENFSMTFQPLFTKLYMDIIKPGVCGKVLFLQI